MTERRSCPSCNHPPAGHADTCAHCGASLVEPEIPPGETRRDPDDLSFPDSPLLRAVVGGATETAPLAPPRGPAPARPVAVAPAPVTPPPVTLHPVAPAPAAPPPVEPRRPAATLRQAPVEETVVLRDLAERLQGRPAAEAEIRYAGFFVRLAAFLVDSAVLALFAIPLIAAGYFGLRAGMLVLGKAAPIEADETLVTILTAAWFVMAGIYFTSMHRAYGQTIGKRWLGLEVRSLGLAPIGPVQSLFRTLGYVASSMFFGFGFLLAGITPRKRAWHDFLAGTCVVRSTPPSENA